MLVAQILQTKASAGVVTVTSQTTVADAAKLLAERKFGSLVISDDGKRAVGILSERDIVRVIALQGAGVLNDPVSMHMTASVVTCSKQATADQVLKTMTDRRFRHMPVVEEGELVGLITLGDVVKSRLSELAMEKDALEGMIMGY
ncbi:MAG: CBS domain-containing protein [Rhodobacteraceae bacterium]|jgi:CBS domain-containing protein|nr:CBS domain-containing protein [Paracoccaceae bacterium]